MKSILFTIVLLLLTTTACGSPSMLAEPPPKTYMRKSKSAIPIPQLNSRETSSVVVPFKKLIEGPVIVLDAGHGGDDYGTHSHGSSKYHEKYLNLLTSELVKKILQKNGYRVLMTRTDDTFISLDQRSLFANQKKPTLFVSIHYNSAPSLSAEGIEIFYYEDNVDKNRAKKSKCLAQSVLSRLIQRTQAKSRGVKQGNLAVLRGTTMPAILIEGGFMTNADEMEKIKKMSYQNSLALGITQGIQDYLVAQALIPPQN